MSNFIIFSVEKGYRTPEANSNIVDLTKLLLKDLHKINFKTVKGVYRGESEVSFVVSRVHEATISSLCKLFDQDCYLTVDNNNNAELVFPGGESTPVGRWQGVTRAIAVSHDSYTESDGNYYVASPNLYPSPAYKKL